MAIICIYDKNGVPICSPRAEDGFRFNTDLERLQWVVTQAIALGWRDWDFIAADGKCKETQANTSSHAQSHTKAGLEPNFTLPLLVAK